MRKTEKIRKAIERLEELKETIYEALNEMEDILREVAPEEEIYWLAHIDGALENRGQWLEGGLVSYFNTIEALEEMMEMEEEREDEEE